MGTTYGSFGPTWPRLARLGRITTRPVVRAVGRSMAFHTPDGAHAQALGKQLVGRLASGESVLLVGIGPAGHNTGVALVEASQTDGIRVLANDEEERFVGQKHYDRFPSRTVELLTQRLEGLGRSFDDVLGVFASWDYLETVSTLVGVTLEHVPRSLAMAHPAASREFNGSHIVQALLAPRQLGRELGRKGPVPIVGMPHHDNHAYFAYGVSPFAGQEESVLVAVVDGFGDRGAVTVYRAGPEGVVPVYENRSVLDSLGMFYGVMSSTQGGWTFLSSEGRYMGAAAWGNADRMTNPFYRRLRQLLYFGENGVVRVNRRMANWHLAGQRNPYRPELVSVVGPPIPREKMWNPDAVLNVEDIEHSDVTTERVDKAAAVQMVFEDALFHIVDHQIRQTGIDRLVLAGGTALNCVANMRLLERFDEAYFRRYLGRKSHLRLWIPPTPGDAGVVMGAPYQFAMRHGAKPGGCLPSVFLCGTSPTTSDIRCALAANDEIRHQLLGNVLDHGARDHVAGRLAEVIARDGIVGIYQGAAETGPRALGHRSILANPCNPRTLEALNARVKFRERIRPLAPMLTLRAAEELYNLAPGASAAAYDAYDYMILTVQAKERARALVPAVVHHDGTSRIQIVRQRNNALMHAYLVALGHRLGVEVSVNTSLNVGSPIVQTPEQAVDVLFRAQGMDGLLMIAEDGEAFAVWRADGSSTSAREGHRSAWLEAFDVPLIPAPETMNRQGGYA